MENWMKSETCTVGFLYEGDFKTALKLICVFGIR